MHKLLFSPRMWSWSSPHQHYITSRRKRDFITSCQTAATFCLAFSCYFPSTVSWFSRNRIILGILIFACYHRLVSRLQSPASYLKYSTVRPRIHIINTSAAVNSGFEASSRLKVKGHCRRVKVMMLTAAAAVDGT